MLHLYRRTIALRRALPALTRGSFTLLETPPGVLGYRRAHSGDAVDVLINFTGEAVDFSAAAGAELLLASDDPDPAGRFDGLLGSDQAVVVRR